MFGKYSDEVLLITHSRLEAGVQNAITTFATIPEKQGYAANSYHLSLALLAEVEDELHSRGIDPHE